MLHLNLLAFNASRCDDGEASRLKARKLILALGKAGFRVERIRGSHHFLLHSDGRATVVPVHSGELIGPGLLVKILHDCELSREQLRDLL